MPASDAGRRHRTVVPVVVAVVLALVTAVLAFMPRQGGDGTPRDPVAAATPTDGTGQQPDAAAEDAAPLARRDPDDPMALGTVDAPVVMVAYSEFQCPFCGRFARNTEPTLIRDYVDTGVLRIEWRDFPYLGEESLTAARGGRAAGEQGRFWEFHDAMYGEQLPPNSGRLTEAYVTGVAERIGLDTEQFREDLGSEELSAAIARDFREGQSAGVTGTPAFLVNGRPVVGAQPTAVFVEAIEQAAAAAR